MDVSEGECRQDDGVLMDDETERVPRKAVFGSADHTLTLPCLKTPDSIFGVDPGPSPASADLYSPSSISTISVSSLIHDEETNVTSSLRRAISRSGLGHDLSHRHPSTTLDTVPASHGTHPALFGMAAYIHAGNNAHFVAQQETMQRRSTAEEKVNPCLGCVETDSATSSINAIGIPPPSSWRTDRNADTIHDAPTFNTGEAAPGNKEWEERGRNTAKDNSIISRKLVPGNAGKKGRHVKPAVPATKVSKARGHGAKQFELQWRIGPAPATVIRMSKEQAALERLMSVTSAYYRGNYERVWHPALQQNELVFDGQSDTETFFSSILMIAGLVAVGKQSRANEEMNKVLPIARGMIQSQHPQTFYFLASLSHDPSQTPLGHLRQQIGRYIAGMANVILGPEHPITILLTVPLSMEQKHHIRHELQNQVHEEYVQTFGPTAYQTIFHYNFAARLFSYFGSMEEALSVSQRVTVLCEEIYGPNSALASKSLIEQARILLAMGQPTILAECLVSDALRRNEMVSSMAAPDAPCRDGAEARHRSMANLQYDRSVALRLLGRIHVVGRNFGAAIHTFRQAVDAARSVGSAGSAGVQLAQIELEAASVMELEHSMGLVSAISPEERLPPISSIVACH